MKAKKHKKKSLFMMFVAVFTLLLCEFDVPKQVHGASVWSDAYSYYNMF